MEEMGLPGVLSTSMDGLATVTGMLLAQAGSDRPGLLFEDRRWTWREHVRECGRYAAALRQRHQPGRPFHVGVLADNVPEFSFLLGGCAFAGAVLVALNPVRRGAALAKDVARTDCQCPRRAAVRSTAARDGRPGAALRWAGTAGASAAGRSAAEG